MQKYRCSLFVLLLAGAFLCSSSGVSPTLAEGPRKVEEYKGQAEVLKKAAQAMRSYAQWCIKHKALSEARHYHFGAASCDGDFAAARKACKPFEDKADEINQEKYDTEATAQRKKLQQSGGEALLKFVVAAYGKGGEIRTLYAAQVWDTYFFDQAALEAVKWVWHEPLLRILPKEDAERWDKGEGRVDGKWLNAEAVLKADEQHAAMTSPWVLTDTRNELRANLPLVRSYRFFSYLSRWRMFFLYRMSSILDLRMPKYPLVCIMAKTRVDYEEEFRRINKELGRQGATNGEGGLHILSTGSNFDPVLISMEIGMNGQQCAIEDCYAERTIHHEVTHQTLYDGHAWNREMQTPEFGAWIWEGMASYCEHYWLSERNFTFEPLRTYASLKGNPSHSKPPLARLRDVKSGMKPIKQFVSELRSDFHANTDVSYPQACALAMYFLDKADASSRAAFGKIVEDGHSFRDSASTFSKHLPRLDLEQFNTTFLAFVETITG